VLFWNKGGNVKKIKSFEKIFMSFAFLGGVACTALAVGNRNLVLAVVAAVLFLLVFLKRKNYTDTDQGYVPNGE
jgi:hypothetical protein